MSIFTEETQKLILAELKETTALTKIIAEGWKIDSWKAVQALVRAGVGAKYFPVGTEFNVITKSYGTLVFQVVAHDHHLNPNDESAHTMTLCMRDVIYGRPFDAVELQWYNDTDAEIPAGTIHFTGYKNDYSQDTKEDGTFQFTFTKPIPVGGGFRHSNMGAWSGSGYSVDRVLGGKFSTYDADGNVLESNLDCVLGSDGTDLGTFSVAYGNINPTIGKANSSQRGAYGSNNWAESGIRQWLNGTGTAWWTKQTIFDRAPSYVSNIGFMEEIGDLADVLGETDIVTGRSTVYEYDGVLGGGSTTRDKIFLLSMTEAGFGNNNVKEGNKLEYYDGASNTDRIKYDYSSKTSARYWWLRSPYYSNASYVRRVTTSGSLNNDYASGGFGAAPACVIM